MAISRFSCAEWIGGENGKTIINVKVPNDAFVGPTPGCEFFVVPENLSKNKEADCSCPRS
ncbi:MAG: hypothetical protein Tsb009_22090 [Planctomycetaceae bacterium]